MGTWRATSANEGGVFCRAGCGVGCPHRVAPEFYYSGDVRGSIRFAVRFADVARHVPTNRMELSIVNCPLSIELQHSEGGELFEDVEAGEGAAGEKLRGEIVSHRLHAVMREHTGEIVVILVKQAVDFILVKGA